MMRNLFAIDKTQDQEATDFDRNPYMVAHVSDEVRCKLEHAFDDLDPEPKPRVDGEELAAEKKILRRDWMICGVVLGVALVLFFLDRLHTDEGLSVWSYAIMALMIPGIVFYYKAQRRSRRLRFEEAPQSDADMQASLERLDEIEAEANRELGVPEDANELEVFPYHYIGNDNGMGTRNAAKKNHFDNMTVSAWVAEEALCMATAQELFRVPLADIRGCTPIDEEFVVDFWLKEEEPDSETYREFNIRKSGLMAHKCRLYYAVNIDGAHGKYEFFVPCYDRDVLKKLGIKVA